MRNINKEVDNWRELIDSRYLTEDEWNQFYALENELKEVERMVADENFLDEIIERSLRRHWSRSK